VVCTRLIIAVVDDEESVRRALGRLLRVAGHEVRSYAAGAEFLRSLSSGRPDCVILDVHMPGLTGFDVLARLQADDVRLPTIVVTGFDEPEAEPRAVRLGAGKFLRKPVREDELLAAVDLAVSAKP
jgi:FixJ family two-component response regulator